MSINLRSIIFEGVDRLGKSTLIEGVQQRLGFMQEIHYQKPKLLDVYLKRARIELSRSDDDLSLIVKAQALRLYQTASFTQMFHLLSSNGKFILNRAHLGETVYAPRYRGYDGQYVFDLEDQFIINDPDECDISDTTLLILLHTSSFEFIKDDGESFDFDKKDEEQNDFIRAFERSKIRYKLMLDVSDGDKFAKVDDLVSTIVQAFNELPSLDHPLINVSWNDGAKIARLQPDPSKALG